MCLLHPLPPSSSSPRLLLEKSTDPTKAHLIPMTASATNWRIRCSQLNLSSSSSSSSSSSTQSGFTSSIGYPPSVELPRWVLGPKYILLLNVAACTAAISTSWMFFSAIPTLLAFKSAAESMEKLLDVTAEELPDTMAAVRLSGVEISDLTMELSDISQEITQGVRSSTKAVRLAEDRLRRLTTMPTTVSVQTEASMRDDAEGPAVATTARNIREGIVKGRSVLGLMFGVTQFSRWALNFVSAKKQKHQSERAV